MWYKIISVFSWWRRCGLADVIRNGCCLSDRSRWSWEYRSKSITRYNRLKNLIWIYSHSQQVTASEISALESLFFSCSSLFSNVFQNAITPCCRSIYFLQWYLHTFSSCAWIATWHCVDTVCPHFEVGPVQVQKAFCVLHRAFLMHFASLPMPCGDTFSFFFS